MSRTAKIISIVGALIFFAALIAVLVVFRVVTPRPPKVSSSVNNTASASKVQEARMVSQKADEVVAGAPGVRCGDLKTAHATDQCMWNVAMAKDDAGLCATMSDETLRTRCRGQIETQTAIAAHDASLCISIQDAASRQTCLRNTIDVKTTAAFCERLTGDDKATCADSRTLFAVHPGSDPAVCTSVVDEELQAACMGIARHAPSPAVKSK